MREHAVGPICFGEFEFDPLTSELRKSGMRVRLSPQLSAILRSLLEGPGRLTTREELKRHLWKQGIYVEFDRSLNKAVHGLRAALGDPAHNPRFIATVAGQGYRFLPVVYASRHCEAQFCSSTRGRSLAVLPFACDRSDPDLDFTGHQLACRLTDAMSQAPGLKVLPFCEVRRALSQQDSAAQAAGQKLGVKSVVIGELMCRGEHLYAHAALISVADGSQLWGAHFRQPRLETIACPDVLADNIAMQLQQALAGPLSDPPPKKPVAGVQAIYRSERLPDAPRSVRSPAAHVTTG